MSVGRDRLTSRRRRSIERFRVGTDRVTHYERKKEPEWIPVEKKETKIIGARIGVVEFKRETEKTFKPSSKLRRSKKHS